MAAVRRVVLAVAVVALGATAEVVHSTKRGAGRQLRLAANPAAKPASKSVYEIDDSPDPHGTFSCLNVRTSRIPHGGKGLFAECPLASQTLLGEYQGTRFMMGQTGVNKLLKADWAYIWKVPRCKAEKDKLQVLKRSDKLAAHKCSSDNGFVYVDAMPFNDELKNPMRFVNGLEHEDEADSGMVRSPDQPEQANVDVFFEDDRVFYFTSKAVNKGDELIVDYGAGYWGEHKNGNELPIPSDDSSPDWGTFVTDQ